MQKLKSRPRALAIGGKGPNAFSFDNGCVAFGDPLEAIQKSNDRRKRSAEYSKQKQQAKAYRKHL